MMTWRLAVRCHCPSDVTSLPAFHPPIPAHFALTPFSLCGSLLSGFPARSQLLASPHRPRGPIPESKEMGNAASIRRRQHRGHRSHRHHPALPPQLSPQPEISPNRYVVFAAAIDYPNPNQPSFYHYNGTYPPVPLTLSGPYTHHRRAGGAVPNWVGGQQPCGVPPVPPLPYVEHQKAITIRNDVNIKRETLGMEPDEENPGKFLVAFTFDATASGSITLVFFGKEDISGGLIAVKEGMSEPVMVSFQQGLDQKFKQPSGTGIDFSMFEETELLQESDVNVYPLMVKAGAYPLDCSDSEEYLDGNFQITQAVFEKERGVHQVRVVKQILWVQGIRYELQEIFGIGNSVDGQTDGTAPGRECVICLSEPSDTTVLPCRHMCMCSECAKVLRFRTNRCPICRQPVEQLLEIKVDKSDE